MGMFLIFTGIVVYGYYKFWGRFEVDAEKYAKDIGYIDQKSALKNNAYELCNDGKIAHTYNGASLKAYKPSKGVFRNNILNTYKNENYGESGYLNFRFLVNCKGEAGWFEIIEMDLNLNESDLNDDMVNQLLHLTSDKMHWKVLKDNGKLLNYYMYVSYRIENGDIIEILP